MKAKDAQAKTKAQQDLNKKQANVKAIVYAIIAMFFVIFDLEAVFVYAWAVAVRELGWAGYCEILVFIGLLAAALLYLWRVGALDWSGEPRRSRSQ